MSALPVINTGGTIAVVDPDTGQILALPDAAPALLARIAEHLDDVSRSARSARAVIGDELGRRMGRERRVDVGAHLLEAATRRSWDADATWAALSDLVAGDLVTCQEADEAMPEVTVRKPDGRRLNALLTRIVADDPMAAQALARARADSTSVKVTRTSIDSTAEAA